VESQRLSIRLCSTSSSKNPHHARDANRHCSSSDLRDSIVDLGCTKSSNPVLDESCYPDFFNSDCYDLSPIKAT
jgi:hypothetical protein